MTGDDTREGEMREIVLRDYTAADDASVRALYEGSFPPSVRAPWSDLVEHRGDERFLVLIDVDATPAGMALIRRLGDTDTTFVRYLAVTADRRDRGLGTQLVAHLRDALRSEEISVLLLDVEDPRGEHAEQDRRRISFYERCGLDLLDVPNYTPPEHGETGEIVPLLLMGEVLDDGPPLAGSRLDAAVAAVMLHRYGVEG
jgi:GNAT superfamily N-acetyltransferase